MTTINLSRIEKSATYDDKLAALKEELAEKGQLIAQQKIVIAELKGELVELDSHLRNESGEQEKLLGVIFCDWLELTKKQYPFGFDFESKIKHYINYRIEHLDKIYNGLNSLLEAEVAINVDQNLIDSFLLDDVAPMEHQAYYPSSNEALNYLEAIEKILSQWGETGKMPIPNIATELIKIGLLYSSSKDANSHRQQYYLKKDKLAKDLYHLLKHKDNQQNWPKVRRRGLFNSLFK